MNTKITRAWEQIALPMSENELTDADLEKVCGGGGGDDTTSQHGLVNLNTGDIDANVPVLGVGLNDVL